MALLGRGVFALATLHHHRVSLPPMAIKHVPSATLCNNNSPASSLLNNMSTSRKILVRCCHYSKAMDESSPRTSAVASDGESVRERYIQHFLLKQEDTVLLQQLQQRLESGEPFANIVLEYSYICPSPTGSENIGQGLVAKYQLLQCPEFAKVAFEAPCRSVVSCKTRFGWHLIQVMGQRDTNAPVKLISPAELHQKMQDPLFYEEAQLIDIREPDEVSQASLPGFQVFPLSKIGTWSRDVTTKLDRSKDTYVLCHLGTCSVSVADWLQLQGFGSIYTVVGGMHAYAKEADPSVPTYNESWVCRIPYAIEKITCKIRDGNQMHVCDCEVKNWEL